MSRSENRHHMERMKRNRRFHWGRDLSWEPANLGKAAITPKPISVPPCMKHSKPEHRRLNNERP